MTKWILPLITLGLLPWIALAATKPVSFKVDSSLIGHTVVAVSSDGLAESATITSSTVNLTPPATTFLLYLLDAESKLDYQVVAKVCTVPKNGASAGKLVCKKKDSVITAFKAGSNLGKLKKLDGALVAGLKVTNYAKSINKSFKAEAANYVPNGIKTFGLAAAGSSSLRKMALRASASTVDEDADGLVGALDSDDDGDGVLDNYETTNQNGGNTDTAFNVFSNFKLDMDASLNLHATGLSQERIDSAMSTVQTLAIQVSGEESSAVELDCGGLSYCSAGGTGRTVEGNLEFPGTAGGSLDSDSDGWGTIARGGTGDFQLKTGADSTSIGAGDTFIQKVTDTSSKEAEIPGMLNFVFSSTPALKTVTTTVGTYNVDYTAIGNIRGSRANCFIAPASGTATLDITGWRPQRPGNSAAGEAEYMDIGHSLITADIPNGACSSPNGSCAAQGPGNCAASSYSTSDPNLVLSNNGLEDQTDDATASSSNTYNFVLDLSNCLDNAAGGAVSWTSGQTIFVDLQFKSSKGDNAAQKFCVTRQ